MVTPSPELDRALQRARDVSGPLLGGIWFAGTPSRVHIRLAGMDDAVRSLGQDLLDLVPDAVLVFGGQSLKTLEEAALSIVVAAAERGLTGIGTAEVRLGEGTIRVKVAELQSVAEVELLVRDNVSMQAAELVRLVVGHVSSLHGRTRPSKAEP